jgi:transcriptional regulator with XRE-family HTH domain
VESRQRRLLVSTAVRAELARKRMSPEQLAVGARIPLSALTPKLNGEQPFDVEELDRVARALRATVASLLSGG